MTVERSSITTAQRIATLEHEINAACIGGDMMLAYRKLQERRALEAELRRSTVRKASIRVRLNDTHMS